MKGALLGPVFWHMLLRFGLCRACHVFVSGFTDCILVHSKLHHWQKFKSRMEERVLELNEGNKGGCWHRQQGIGE
jgi:hypothetical protein